MEGLLSTTDKFGRRADLFNDIKEIGWTTTPFFASLTAKAPASDTNSSFGHEWNYMNIPQGSDTNAYDEGSAPAPATKFGGGNAKNHYQIFKDTYGVTGSEDVGTETDGKKAKARQMAMSSFDHRMSIERALLSATAPVQRDNTVGAKVAGKLGGVKHFLTVNNDFDMSVAGVGTALTWKILREILKPGFFSNMPVRILMMNDTQKDALDDILFSKTTGTSFASERLDNNITMIGNTAYGNNIKVIVSPFLAQDEILAYNPEFVNPVVYRPTFSKDIPSGDDVNAGQFITEMTLRVHHELAICRLKGLAV
ncbi:DUF5309 family protein [Sulfuricurvum sp.]|uniref:SU10 major capsid protein n=1 Tax=Sulfuricurvum sp. TaxID=2025608 RepID=UPI00262E94E2|nr:DUF5309 family protein [Sulfuricurvum sp.]MDD2267655.1 DUF5309 family protein [Sulfuricurvum sp.]MDD2784256.1 DUF5309 family protein [Sulfuricurvum sp.]